VERSESLRDLGVGETREKAAATLRWTVRMISDGFQKHQLEEPIDGEVTAGPIRPNLVGEQRKHLAQTNGRRLGRRDHHERRKEILQ
jgi:hypothetical protein